MHKQQYKIIFNLENKHWWFLSKRKFIRAVMPPAKGNLKVLDIGAGTGGTTKFIKLHCYPWRSTGFSEVYDRPDRN